MNGNVQFGTVARKVEDKGYGFITPAGSTSREGVFFHMSELQDDPVFEELAIGADVQYTLEQSDRGPRARNVRRG